ncbi:4-(cytidine 5'-diphospho)-2-C-methyl-D-erythritol kinase [Thermodesulfobacteriota bacterium]
MAISSYRIKAPAKVNIRLKVTGCRPDGYHELVSIMVPVNLFDILELKSPFNGHIKITHEGFDVPSDESNLIWRAAESFMSRTGIDSGVSIKLIKNIPIAAGLGGGSSDAAATLLALNKIYSRPLSESGLHNLAINLGADVPFFLDCRPSLVTGVGEILEPLDNWPEFWYVIITPPIRVSTSWAYGNLKLELTIGEYDYIVNFLKTDNFAISHILENDLEKVTSTSFPIINTLKKLLVDAGAAGAIMSGSGPSVFGLFLSPGKAKSARDSLISLELGDVFMVKGGGTELIYR